MCRRRLRLPHLAVDSHGEGVGIDPMLGRHHGQVGLAHCAHVGFTGASPRLTASRSARRASMDCGATKCTGGRRRGLPRPCRTSVAEHRLRVGIERSHRPSPAQAIAPPFGARRAGEPRKRRLPQHQVGQLPTPPEPIG